MLLFLPPEKKGWRYEKKDELEHGGTRPDGAYMHHTSDGLPLPRTLKVTLEGHVNVMSCLGTGIEKARSISNKWFN